MPRGRRSRASDKSTHGWLVHFFGGSPTWISDVLLVPFKTAKKGTRKNRQTLQHPPPFVNAAAEQNPLFPAVSSLLGERTRIHFSLVEVVWGISSSLEVLP